MAQLQDFESDVPYSPDRIRAAAVYCSDGRYGEHIDDLLQRGLHLPRYDRLAVPGGAACLAGHFPTYREEQGVVEQLRFLVDVHQIEQVVLVAHSDCAFYLKRLRTSPLQLESQQRLDLQKATRRVQRFSRLLKVHAFIGRRHHSRVVFEPFVP